MLEFDTRGNDIRIISITDHIRSNVRYQSSNPGIWMYVPGLVCLHYQRPDHINERVAVIHHDSIDYICRQG